MSGTIDGPSTTRDGNAAVSRRGFLRATAGGTAVVGAAGATGAAAAQADRPDFGGWLDGVDGGFEDARGRSEVTVRVGTEGNGGNFAFDPAGLWVDPGTTVSWEWTGQGSHNVVAQEGAEFSSGNPVQEPGVQFEHIFDGTGVVTYQCNPHASLGMKGAVAVGGDVPMAGDSGNASSGGGSAGDDESQRIGGLPSRFAPIGAVALAGMGLATLATLYLTLIGVRADDHQQAAGEE